MEEYKGVKFTVVLAEGTVDGSEMIALD